jgi:hypothetical protein
MLRIASTLLLILVYTLSLCRMFVPFLHYLADQKSYAERCVNTAKPEMDCCGKCQVKKEIAEAEMQDTSSKHQTTPSSQRIASNETADFFYLLAESPQFPSPETGIASFLPFVNTSLLSGFGTVPFQPPRA